MAKFFLLLFICNFFYSCNDSDSISPSLPDSTLVQLSITSNYKYPVVFILKDLAAIESINTQGLADSVPIIKTFKIGHGTYDISAYAIRDTADPFYNMLDSNSAWIKVTAIIESNIIAEGNSIPIAGQPLSVVAEINFHY